MDETTRTALGSILDQVAAAEMSAGHALARIEKIWPEGVSPTTPDTGAT